MEMPAAQRIAAWISLLLPKHLPSTRTGSTCTPGAAPAMPLASSVLAPTRLEVLVPCHELALATADPVPAGSHL